MKKFNWRMVVFMVLIAVATVAGVCFMEETWIEKTTPIIWVTGMICGTVVYVVNEIRRMK